MACFTKHTRSRCELRARMHAHAAYRALKQVLSQSRRFVVGHGCVITRSVCPYACVCVCALAQQQLVDLIHNIHVHLSGVHCHARCLRRERQYLFTRV